VPTNSSFLRHLRFTDADEGVGVPWKGVHRRKGRGISYSIVEQISIHSARWIPDDAVFVFEDVAHSAPEIVTAPHNLIGGFLFGAALDFADDGADAGVVLDAVVEFGFWIEEALGGFGFFDPAKQLGIADVMSAGVDFDGSKRKLGLMSKPTLRAGVREDLADGDSDFLDDLSDHFGGHLKTAGRTFTGGADFL
jgi:hypothetical protein